MFTLFKIAVIPLLVIEGAIAGAVKEPLHFWQETSAEQRQLKIDEEQLNATADKLQKAVETLKNAQEAGH